MQEELGGGGWGVSLRMKEALQAACPVFQPFYNTSATNKISDNGETVEYESVLLAQIWYV